MSNYGLLVQPPHPLSVAIHESAHAIIALYYRLPVTKLTIVRQGDEMGSCLFKALNTPPRITASVFLAGYLAAKHIDQKVDVTTANADLTEAMDLLPPGTDLKEFVAEVRLKVETFWPEIQRLAEALERDRELVGAHLISSIASLPSWARY